MAFLTIQFRNLKERILQLTRFGESLAPRYAAALYQEAEIVMTEAKEKYVPVDTGVLRASGHVQQPRISGDSVSVEMGFGGPAAAYAEVVHEDLNAQHTVGQAKYLELPLRNALPGIQRALDEAVDRARREAGL